MIQELNGELVEQVTTSTPIDLQAMWQNVTQLRDAAKNASDSFNQAMADFNAVAAAHPTIVAASVPDLSALTGPIEVNGLDMVIPVAVEATPVETPVTVEPTPVTIDPAPVDPVPAQLPAA